MKLKEKLADFKIKFSMWRKSKWEHTKWPNHGKYGSAEIHKEMVDFTYGMIIGLLIGFIVGGMLIRIL